MTIKPVPALFIVALGVGLIVQWRLWPHEVGQQGPATPIPQVKHPVVAPNPAVAPTMAPQAHDTPGSRITAQLTPASYTTLSSQLNAMIQSIPLREGQSFRTGQVLVTFDCATERARLARSRAALAIASRTAETDRQLLELGSVSRVETENAKSEVQKAQGEIAELSAIMAYCQLRAPFSGKISAQRVRPKQFVQSAQPLLDVIESGPMDLEFIAPSNWVAWLKPGDGFKIRIDETSTVYAAHVVRTGAVIDPVSQTIKVTGQIDGDRSELRPGMSGEVFLQPPHK
jgi:RND family efflux transporter MFP subunit